MTKLYTTHPDTHVHPLLGHIMAEYTLVLNLVATITSTGLSKHSYLLQMLELLATRQTKPFSPPQYIQIKKLASVGGIAHVYSSIVSSPWSPLSSTVCGQIFYLGVFEVASHFGGGSKAMRSEYVEVENTDISNWPQALTTPLYLRPYFRGNFNINKIISCSGILINERVGNLEEVSC